MTGAVVPARGQQDRGPALADLADALERLGARAEQRPELPGQRRIIERFPGYREYPPQRPGRQERREDQVDETALVALAAPVIKSTGLVTVKSLITTTERTVVLLKRREFLPDPELGPVSQPGKVLR